MLRSRLSDALKVAMKAKESLTVATIRLTLAALKDRDIAARSKGNMDGVPEDEILSLLQSMIKQRRESVEMYEKGGRQDLAEKEAGKSRSSHPSCPNNWTPPPSPPPSMTSSPKPARHP